MFIKVLTRKSPSYGQLIDYILREQQGQNPFLLQNFRGTDREAWITELKAGEANRANRRKDNVALYHEIMSFHQGSTIHLDDEKLRSLAYEYAKTRNPNAQVIASVHRDTDHVHLHFLVSGTEHATGRATRLSMADLRGLKEHMQEFQQEQYPELSDSLIDFQKDGPKVPDKEFQLRERTEKPILKERLQTALTDSFSKAMSREEFTTRLKEEYDIELYERNGNQTGVAYNNQKFRFFTLDFDPSALNQLDEIEQELSELEKLRTPPGQSLNRLEEFTKSELSAEAEAPTDATFMSAEGLSSEKEPLTEGTQQDMFVEQDRT